MRASIIYDDRNHSSVRRLWFIATMPSDFGNGFNIVFLFFFFIIDSINILYVHNVWPNINKCLSVYLIIVIVLTMMCGCVRIYDITSLHNWYIRSYMLHTIGQQLIDGCIFFLFFAVRCAFTWQEPSIEAK